MKPYVVAERQDVTGTTLWQRETERIRRAFQEETADTLQSAFERVVDEGTGTNARIEGLHIAGKTGTALQIKNGTYSTEEARASFVGFFPADDPKVALLVMLGAPETSIYGGEVAAPIFRRVARRWAGTFPEVVDRMTPDQTSVFEDALPEEDVGASGLSSDSSTSMPDLSGLSTRRALEWLREQGIDSRVRGQGRIVQQHPRPGTPLPSQATLRATH